MDDQFAHGDTACEQNGWVVQRRYGDKVSASRFGSKPRDEWDELVADVTADMLDVVVIWDASRGDRTPATWAGFLERCRATSTRIYAIRDKHLYDMSVPRDWKTLHEAGVDSGYESEVRSSDTRRGVATAAAAGKPHGRPGFGYSRHYDPADRKKFEDRPNDDAPIAEEIIRRVAKRDPVSAIASDLDARGLIAPGGGRWSRKAVKLIAVNPRYVGKRSHKPTGSDRVELHDATWPAIVDELTFARAQAVLGESDRKTSPPGQTRYLLTYFATCGTCQSLLSAGRHASNPRPRYRCANNGCMSLDVWAADEWILLLVLGRLAKPDARALFADDAKELDAANAEAVRLKAQIEEARAAYDDDVIDAESLGRKLKRLKPDLEKAQRRVLDATQANAVLDLLGEGEFTAEYGRPRWEGLSIPARRSVVKGLFASITLLPADRRLSSRCTDAQRVGLASERLDIEWT